MIILRRTRQAFSLLGYLSHERIFAFKFGHAIASSVFMLVLILFELSSVIYVVRHLKIGDFKNSLYAGLQMMAVLPAIASFITMMYHKDKVRDVIDGFQKISDQCNSVESTPDRSKTLFIPFSGARKSSAAYFNRANRISEKYLLLAFVVVVGGFIVSSIMFAALTYAYYWKRDGHVEFKNLYLPYRTR